MSSRLEDGKPALQLVQERERRVTQAIELEIPDRVPVVCDFSFFVAKYSGIPCSAAYYDSEAWFAAYRKALEHFQPDMGYLEPFTSGAAMELLDPKTLKWPGHGVDPNHGFQAVEVDGLQEDEYDLFLHHTADYLFRLHLPRLFGGLEFLSLLPELADLGWLDPWAGEKLALWVTDPQVEAAFARLQAAGRELRTCRHKADEFEQLVAECGVPQLFQGGMLPPFDVVSNSLRGMKGTMLDMYRQPDKLLEACDLILEHYLRAPLPAANEFGATRMFITNTRGADNFMSTQQFDTFYWPTFKKLVLSLVERGATPVIFFEASFDSRLEHLLEFPKGKVLVRLEKTDIFRAKEVLGGHLCLQGNLPSTLLQIGTAQEVRDYCRKLIDVVGEGGGFILSPRAGTADARPENLKAMLDFTREYGKY